MTDLDFVAGFYLALAIILVLIGIPLANRKIPPNKWIGYRTAATRANEKLWYQVNEALGKALLRWGIPIVFLFGFLFAQRKAYSLDALAWFELALTLTVMGVSILKARASLREKP